MIIYYVLFQKCYIKYFNNPYHAIVPLILKHSTIRVWQFNIYQNISHQRIGCQANKINFQQSTKVIKGCPLNTFINKTDGFPYGNMEFNNCNLKQSKVNKNKHEIRSQIHKTTITITARPKMPKKRDALEHKKTQTHLLLLKKRERLPIFFLLYLPCVRCCYTFHPQQSNDQLKSATNQNI